MQTLMLKTLFLGAMTQAAWATPPPPVIDVYKSPSCGCCVKWVDHLKAQGFTVRSHDTDDVVQHKYRLGVPPGHGSCHTAEVAGYLVEGHVPAMEIKRLLRLQPLARGLAVPAMPVGSPGMEQGDSKDAYEILLVNRDGTTRTWARY